MPRRQAQAELIAYKQDDLVMKSESDRLLSNPAVEKFLERFRKGDTLCSEGDDSKDLYFLISGTLDIIKGKRKISEVYKSGVPIGEISFLLNTKRTATVKAKTDGQVVRVPKDKIDQFLREVPSLAWRISKVLARRLDERTRTLHGLEEFCDQMPEAVVVTDSDGRVVAWNNPAERLFGYGWDQMYNRSLAEVYETPEIFNAFVAEVKSKHADGERIFKIDHAEKGPRHISTSIKAIYDQGYTFAGVLSLSRDVTDTVKLKQRYRRVRLWSIPIILLLAIITAAVFLVYPHFTSQTQIAGIRQQALTDQIGKDYFLVKSILTAPFGARDRVKITQLMKEFFQMQGNAMAYYPGIVLLEKDKKVFGYYTPDAEGSTGNASGDTYTGITFEDSQDSIHKILTLYRVHPDYPMGRQEIEIAFELRKGGRFLGWLIFQLDMDRLEREFKVDLETLKKMQIQKR